MNGRCGCECNDSRLPDRCQLLIPYPQSFGAISMDEEGVVDEASLREAASQEFDAYKAIERWAYRFTSSDCGCGE